MTYTVIVAEDEELLLTNLVQKIQKADPDFQVAGTAQTGDQALALVEKLSPDLVVTDIRMPVMDGITLLTKVREQFPFTKFIITSGFSDFEYAKKAITLKVSDYLLKPVDSEELKEALSKIKQEFQIAGNDYEEVFNARTAAMTPTQIATFEIGQWCVYPNFKEMAKYDGVMRPRNFEIFQETLAENGMAHLADSFLLASGKLQALCYKADIEAALRTKDFGGFQLLGLSDFPGQGTALVGVLDAFWEEKGYIRPEEYRRFCNSTVPLLRLPKLIYTNKETVKGSLEVAHFGAAPLEVTSTAWTLKTKEGNKIASGKHRARND